MTVDEEIPLHGGDVTEGVVRLRDTVRRPVGLHTLAVHALLGHLQRVGFDGAPRALGIDDRGREILSWLPGEAPGRPLPAYAVTDQALVGVARLLRDYHDAAASFEPPPGAAWDTQAASSLDGPPELIGHCDVTPENVVFRDGTPCALLDFDLARPVTRLFDVVTALWHWAPLNDPADRDPHQMRLAVGPRLRLFCQAYGLDEAHRRALLPAARLRIERSWAAMRDRAEQRGGGWARMWADGVGDRIRRAQAWLEQEWDALDVYLR